MTTMILDLPVDLVNEILSRVPLKSMRALRLTCRKWNTLSKSRSFTKIHKRRLAADAKKGESQIIVWKGNDLYLMSIVVNENPSTKPLAKLTGLNEQVISDLFQCEGLLLFILYYSKYDTKIFVLNPFLGKTRWIEPRYSHRGGWFTRYTYALGYMNNKEKKSCCSRHKILRFCDNHYNGVRHLLYELYDFDTNLWKTLDVPPLWHIPYYQCGISLKGNTYWCAKKYEEKDRHIICFDFTRERFGPLLHLPFGVEYYDCVTFSCVREEKLAALVEHSEGNPYKIEIWITTNIEVEEVLWSKFLTFDTKPECPISTWSFFIDEEKKVVMGFDEVTFSIAGEAGYLRKLDLRKSVNTSHFRTKVCSYVPSLVQIKQHEEEEERERKIQSKLEKHRYGEKKLKRSIDMVNGN